MVKRAVRVTLAAAAGLSLTFMFGSIKASAAVKADSHSQADAAEVGAASVPHCNTTLPTGTVVGMATTADGKGYWIASSTGKVAACGDATFFGNGPSGTAAVASAPSGNGYWLVTKSGAVYTFGSAIYHGGVPSAVRLAKPIVAMAADPATGGYWLLGGDGGVFSFNAPFYGSTGNIRLAQPAVGLEATLTGKGYRFVAADGGIFDYGDARFYGSLGHIRLNKPVVGMANDPATGGYWLDAADGGIFSFHAPFYGSTGNIRLAQPCVGMTGMPDGRGYRFVAADGGIFDFGDAPFEGSAAPTKPSGGGAGSCARPIYSTSNPDGAVNIDGGAEHWWVNNDAWNGSHGPQSIYVCNQSSWYAISDQPNRSGAVETYPDTEYDVGGRNTLSTKPISGFTSITSTFSEADPPAGSWDAAYDLWLNNWGTEIMIWNQWAGSQAYWPGIAKTALTLDGVPYHFYKNGAELMFFRDSQVSSGSVDILAAFDWLVSHGLVKSSDVPTQLEYGVEIASTSGSEAFPLTGLTFSVG